MTYENLIYEKRERVGIVTMNRPEHLNAMSSGMEAELKAVFAEMDSDDEVRASILTATGRGFCSGAYLKDENKHVISGPAVVLRPRLKGRSTLETMWDYSRDRAERVLARPLARLTPYTITQSDRLRTVLRRIRHDGYGMSVEESKLGYVSVATPVFGAGGALAGAISVVGTTTLQTHRVLDALRGASDRISRDLSAHATADE